MRHINLNDSIKSIFINYQWELVSSQKFCHILHSIKSLRFRIPIKHIFNPKATRITCSEKQPLERKYLETKIKKKSTRDEKNGTPEGILISDKQRGKKRGSFEIFPFYPFPLACVIRVESYFDRAQNFKKPYFFHPSDKRLIFQFEN